MSLTPDQGTGGTIAIIPSGVNVQLQASSLLFEYLTPDPINPIPKSLVSSYFSIVSYPTKSTAPIAPGGNVSLTMQSVQLTSIPRRMYIFARDDDSVLTPFSSDCFMSLATNANPLTVTWNNNQFFSQSTTADLYNIAVKNGCNLSWSQFTNFTGSVLVLDWGTDVGLMSDECAGVLGNYQLGLTCQFTNTRSTPITPTLYIIICYEGSFNVENGNCSHMIGVLSRQNVLESQRVAGVNYKAVESVYGGDFYSKLKGFLGKAHNFIKDKKLISRAASAIPHPYAQALGRAAADYGYGMSGGSLKDNDSKKVKMTKDELKRRLRAQENQDQENIYEDEQSQEGSESDNE